MLVSLGRKTTQPEDLVALLLACHTRIRSFIALAQRAASDAPFADDERAAACAQVERYFNEALPLHVADEEVDVLPALRGLDADVDRALDTMHAQHDEHEAPLAALLAACRAVRSNPRDATARATLATTANTVGVLFEEHLSLEEREIFPAVRSLLDEATQHTLKASLRTRRER